MRSGKFFVGVGDLVVTLPPADGRRYSPEQPRDPAGTSTGGQWTDWIGHDDIQSMIPQKLPDGSYDEEIYDLKNPPKEIEGVPIIPAELKYGQMGGARVSNHAIYMTTNANTLDKVGDQFEFMRTRYEAGWWSSPHPNHPFWHELGHVRAYQALDLWDKGKAVARLNGHAILSDPDYSIAAGKVSRYAQTNPAEFIAEVYAGRRAGRKFDADVMDKFTRLLDGKTLEGMPK